MKKLKIAAASLLPFIAGILILIGAGGHINTEMNLEPFFYAWLILIAVCTGFVTGTQYPLKPLRSGMISGLILVFILDIALIWLSPLFIAPLFLLALGVIIVGITGGAAFFGAIFLRAKAILVEERKTEVSDDLD